jgi:MFS family permease
VFSFTAAVLPGFESDEDHPPQRSKAFRLMRGNSPASAERRTVDSAYAWLMAFVAFLTCFVVFGVVYSFGAFFRPMAAEFGSSRAHTSIIFSLTAAIYSVLGLIGGRFTDRFGPRNVMLVGALALGAGLITTSFAPSLSVAYLTYGLGVGVGVACGYVPMLAVVGGWFRQRRNAAMGVAVSGIGAGTLAVAPLAAAMIQHYGWRESYALIGVAGALILAGCGLLATAPPITANAAPRPIMHLARSPDFAILYFSALLVSVTIYVPFVYLPDFAQSRGIGEVPAAALVGFVGAASMAGRLSFGPIADRIGILKLYKTSLLVMAFSYVIWPLAHSYTTLTLFTIVMGVAYGGMVSLSPAVVAELFGVEDLGTVLGALYTSSAISALAGPPLVGLAIDYGGSYLWAAAIAGSTGLVAFFVLIPLQTPMVESRTEQLG